MYIKPIKYIEYTKYKTIYYLTPGLWAYPACWHSVALASFREKCLMTDQTTHCLVCKKEIYFFIYFILIWYITPQL